MRDNYKEAITKYGENIKEDGLNAEGQPRTWLRWDWLRVEIHPERGEVTLKEPFTGVVHIIAKLNPDGTLRKEEI